MRGDSTGSEEATDAGSTWHKATYSRSRCRIFGHDYSFNASEGLLIWECSRGCGAGGEKAYQHPELAARYAEAFDRRDTQALGRRAPLIGLLPLRLWRWMRRAPADRKGQA